jgi:hypothetical protein
MMAVAYIYIYIYIHTHTHIRRSYFLIKQKISKSKKNYIKIAMPVAKHTAEYAWKSCLEGILSVWVS